MPVFSKAYQPDLPECPVALLEALKQVFDTRRLLYRQGVSIEYLKGVQDVLNTIEATNREYHEEEEI